MTSSCSSDCEDGGGGYSLLPGSGLGDTLARAYAAAAAEGAPPSWSSGWRPSYPHEGDEDDEEGEEECEAEPRPFLFDVQITFDGGFDIGIFTRCVLWFTNGPEDLRELEAKVRAAVHRLRDLLASPALANFPSIMSIGERVDHPMHGRPGIVHVLLMKVPSGIEGPQG